MKTATVNRSVRKTHIEVVSVQDAPTRRNWRSTSSLAIVLALHAGALYAVTREAEYLPPVVSVPMVISLATVAEQAPVKPTPKPREPEPKPVLSEMPAPVVEPEKTASSKEDLPAEIIPPDTKAAYLNNPQPEYPPLARKLGEQGRVVLRVYVEADGGVREVQVKTSSGFSRLDRSAREGVSRWKFEPARQGRQTIGAWTVIPISFVLNKG